VRPNVRGLAGQGVATHHGQSTRGAVHLSPGLPVSVLSTSGHTHKISTTLWSGSRQYLSRYYIAAGVVEGRAYRVR